VDFETLKQFLKDRWNDLWTSENGMKVILRDGFYIRLTSNGKSRETRFQSDQHQANHRKEHRNKVLNDVIPNLTMNPKPV